jgi:pimeloyl-ACP methyl ester carboxylesterase
VVIAGHAFGNWVARTFATDHPDLVRAVILIAAAGRAPIDPELHALIPRCADMALPAAERLGYLYRAFFAAGSDAKGWLTGWYPLVGNMQRGATSRTPQNDFIRAGVAPILDLQAADDTLVPQEYSQDLKRELGDRVTVQVIARAGHALPVEQPRAVCDAIVTYLDSVDERSALSL